MSKFVAVLMGSKSDKDIMQETIKLLQELEIKYEFRILSAHRTPIETAEYIKDAENRNCQVFIAAAGMAAHLAGAVAANTTKPVIGVPINASLNGLDSLLSTVQMPPGMPVATVAIGKAGAKNAALLAAQILGLNDPEIANKVIQKRINEKNKILAESQLNAE